MEQRVSDFPAPNSVQRISQQFYNSEPIYSEPPALLVTEPPPVLRDPARTKVAQWLFAALFVPTLLLLAFALMR